MIHADIDMAEIGKLRRPDVALCGDIVQAFNALSVPLNIAEWQAHIKQLKQTHDFVTRQTKGIPLLIRYGC